ncbi:tRNA-guanine(15) transglycosylase-like protein [Schizothecium vesticola]|uniref:Queuine tRNA-ribosyltransferase accessory subunit 2 n=1 Tax=Schizothecium vesticola TaxID=314040 RepID=A0AA40F6R4_9PEZI|nr:tRNA-guanine(15) transglycosylase-like protein [Schizothecium vesticola]
MSNDTQDDTPTMKFEVLKAAITDGSALRLGRLAFSGRRTIDTPNYFAVTSRGAIPHITPDNVNNHLHTSGVYMALEDCNRRTPATPPSILPPPRHLHHPVPPPSPHLFHRHPPSLPTILAARRLPAVAAPKGNTNTSISIFTSTGFQTLTPAAYTSALATLRPDIAIPLSDLPPTLPPSAKRALRMSERTDTWLSDFHLPSPVPSTSLFAPILPVPLPLQREYLHTLLLHPTHISGLALYSPSLLPSLLALHPTLAPLPRLDLSAPSTPHAILRLLSLGVDAFVLPFINAVSDAGVAMTFSFPPPSPPTGTQQQQQPLGIDLHAPSHRTSLAPLAEGCTCYACASHHRAYAHHLLSAREMLGWTLLQIHNHAVVARFFAGVREALGHGTFAEGARRFEEGYEAEFPAGTGERPRARGYQTKSEGGRRRRGRG